MRNMECVCVCVYIYVFSSTESVGQSLGEPCTRLFFSMSERYNRLSILIGRHSVSLTYFLHDMQGHNVTSLPLLTHIEHFLDIYRE